MKHLIFCILIVLAFSQCKQGSKRTAGELVVIDVTKEYPLKRIYLQDVADIEYIPFGINDSTLMRFSFTRMHVSDNYIVSVNPMSSQGDILVFDGKGNPKFSFNNQGQGPEEYNFIGSFAFDEKAKEIFVFSPYSSTPKLLVYAEDGKYKRTLALPPRFNDVKLYNYNDETLLVYDESGVFGVAGTIEQEEYSHKPYMFMSKADGSIVDTLNTHLPERLSNIAVWDGEREGQPVVFSRGITITNNRSFGKDFVICDWSSDTIYRLTLQRELQPLIVRTPSMPETDPKILISCFLITDKFLLLGIHEMDYVAIRNAGGISAKQIIYDFETGEINEYRFINRDITTSSSVRMWEATVPGNTGVSMYDVDLLFRLEDNDELTGDLKEVVKALDEDDNPVLMKIKFH